MTAQLVEAIEKALAEDADDGAKQRGADACRSVLAALETKPGEPLVAATAMAAPPTPLAAAAPLLGSAPPSTVLDALIAKLKAELPDDSDEPTESPIRITIPFVPLPKKRG